MNENPTHQPETNHSLSAILLLRKWGYEGKTQEGKTEIFKKTHKAIMEILEEAKTNK